MPPDFEMSVSNLEFSQTRYGWGFKKIPAKVLIFEEILKETFQLSIEHSIFYLEFMSVCVAALLLSKPCSSYYSGFGILPGTKSIYISTASLQELKELGTCKYEYLFGVYHNNETD